MPNFNFVRTPPVIYLPAKGGGQLKLDTQQVQQPTNTDWKRHIAVCDELTGGRFFFRPMQGSGDERDAHISVRFGLGDCYIHVCGSCPAS